MKMQNRKCISQPAWYNALNVLCWNVLAFQVSGSSHTVIVMHMSICIFSFKLQLRSMTYDVTGLLWIVFGINSIANGDSLLGVER